QGPSDGLAVLLDAQLRLAGEVAETMQEEFEVFLERGTSGKRRFIATERAVEDQLAARRNDIAEQLHLRTATGVQHHLHALPSGDPLKAADQIFLFRRDDRFGAKSQYELAVLAMGTGGDNAPAESLGQLHRCRSGAMPGLGDQYVLTRLQLRQLHQREVGNQQRRVMHRS